MADNLSKKVKATRAVNATVAGTTAINCAAIDMANFDSIMAVVAFGTLSAGAVTGLKWQQSSDNAATDAYDDLAGSALAIPQASGSNQLLISEVVRPQKRYVRLVITRGTGNAVVDSATYLQFLPRVLPTTHDATTVAAMKQTFSPAEGTA